MRALLISSLFALALTLIASSSRADRYDAPFSFRVSSYTPGCIDVTYTNYYQTDFPKLPNGEVVHVRFFYSDIDADSVTVNSPFDESSVELSEYGSVELAPTHFCGYPPGKYFFKYGLFDANNNFLKYMDADEWEDYDHSTDVE